MDQETREQLDAEAQDHFEEWAVEKQDRLETHGPEFHVSFPDGYIPF